MKRLEDMKVEILDRYEPTGIIKAIKDLTPEEMEGDFYFIGIDDIDIKEQRRKFFDAVDKFTNESIEFIKNILVNEAFAPTRKEIEFLKNADSAATVENEKRLIAERIEAGYGSWGNWSDVNLLLAKAATALKVMTDIRMFLTISREQVFPNDGSRAVVWTNADKLETLASSQSFSTNRIAKDYLDIGLGATCDKNEDAMFRLYIGLCSFGNLPFDEFDSIDPITKEDILNVHLDGRTTNIACANEYGERIAYVDVCAKETVLFAPSNLINLFANKIRVKNSPEYKESVLEFVDKMRELLPTIVANRNRSEKGEPYHTIFIRLWRCTHLWTSDSLYGRKYKLSKMPFTDESLTDEIIEKVFNDILDRIADMYINPDKIKLIDEFIDEDTGERKYFHLYASVLGLDTMAMMNKVLIDKR